MTRPRAEPEMAWGIEAPPVKGTEEVGVEGEALPVGAAVPAGTCGVAMDV